MPPQPPGPVPPLYERVTRDGETGIAANFHPGQQRAWLSEKRVVAIIAGGQSGKSTFAPLWLHREMKRQGPGDYLVAGPNYRIISKTAGPEVQLLFERTLRLGTMKRSPWEFTFSEDGCRELWGVVPERPSRIVFGHADEPQSLESMTARAAWLDEAGQNRFRLGSWETVQQRLAVGRGRCLITTKPYNLGWLKKLVYDEWERAGRNHPDIDVINFASTMNPAFPPEEDERARLSLPGWKYRMHYKGIFERPAGLIYDCFEEGRHVVAPFAVPPHWHRYGGLDFGGVNTAAVKCARHPGTGHLYVYDDYHAGSRTAADHARAILGSPPQHFLAWVGGSKSEGQWRAEFAQGGVHVMEPPVSDVEVGIQRVYSLLKLGQLSIFSTCAKLIDEVQSYSRELDDAGEPTEKIEDKEKFHRLDALRYLSAWLVGDGSAVWIDSPVANNTSEYSRAPEGVWISDGRGD